MSVNTTMTVEIKDELSQVVVSSASARRAEVASMLRFAGGLRVAGAKVLVEVDVDMARVARRLRQDLFDLYGCHTVVRSLPDETGTQARYVLQVATGGEALARQTGLLDSRGRPVRGLPSQVVGGSIGDAEAAWRGAFLARGAMTGPTRSPRLEVKCPGFEAALALLGAARRLGVSAKVLGEDRVVVRDGDGIGALLARLGARDTLVAWEERRERRAADSAAHGRLANFTDANVARAELAAEATAARVERAFEILGDSAPAELAAAGRLRLEYRHASLEELGRLSTPQLTKDAVSGRIRRLLLRADRKAEAEGLPDTQAPSPARCSA